MLRGAIFVAHNAQFDHAFIAEEYRLLDRRLTHQRACTVQLSRYFYPQYQHYKLDVAIERHNIGVVNRHRAPGDAQVPVDFYQVLCAEYGAPGVATAVTQRYHFQAFSQNRYSTLAYKKGVIYFD
ncbi:3'-5' exonuclease [bacterium]|nr:3'-5' exonuclease [bacterium]